jgi:sterol desaturase/sphingolipid hydroxylase (fatty acid hydroxylase superfamily)
MMVGGTARGAMGRVLIYPLVLAAALGMTWWLSVRWGDVVSAGVVIVASALAVGGLELVLPHTQAWAPKLGTLRVDLTHTIVSGAAVAPLLQATLFAGFVALGSELTSRWGLQLWPSGWPVALQTTIAIVVADLGAYAGHRFMHATDVGWRMHAVHHSATRLYFLASARAHPFNACLTLSLESAPLLLLGITPEALLLYTVFKAVNGLLQHSNVALAPGVLSYIIATSDVHRWHHSTNFDESNRNFGNTTMVWDHVFGTFFLPRSRQPGDSVGIGDADIPERYLTHLATPFVLSRFETPTEPPPP